jgi:hypothetical protein
MNLIVGILMAVRSLTFMASFVTSDSSAVHFTEPRLVITSQEVRMNISLQNALTGELLTLSSTGTTIPIYLYVDLMRDGLDEPVNRRILETRLQYDFTIKQYRIIKGGHDDTVICSTRDSAIAAACGYQDLSIFSANLLDANADYYINIYAVLGKTTVEALGNNAMDLMYYWNFKRPSLRTAKYKGGQFILKRS